MGFSSVSSHLGSIHFNVMNALHTLSILKLKTQSIHQKEVFINV
jgi:hypothetical protein